MAQTNIRKITEKEKIVIEVSSKFHKLLKTFTADMTSQEMFHAAMNGNHLNEINQLLDTLDLSSRPRTVSFLFSIVDSGVINFEIKSAPALYYLIHPGIKDNADKYVNLRNNELSFSTNQQAGGYITQFTYQEIVGNPLLKPFLDWRKYIDEE